MYSQSDSSSPLPEGVCGPPRRGAGGKISKGQGLGVFVGRSGGLSGKNEGMFPCKGTNTMNIMLNKISPYDSSVLFDILQSNAPLLLTSFLPNGV